MEQKALIKPRSKDPDKSFAVRICSQEVCIIPMVVQNGIATFLLLSCSSFVFPQASAIPGVFASGYRSGLPYGGVHKCRTFPNDNKWSAFGTTVASFWTRMAFRSQSAQSALSSLAFAFLTIAAGTARAGLTLRAYHYGLLSNSKAIHIRVSVQVILNLKNKKLFGGASCTGEFVRPSFSNILVTHAQLFSVRCHHNWQSNCFFAWGLGCTQCGKNIEWLCNRPSLVEQCWVQYPILVQIGRQEQNGNGPSLKIRIPQGHEPSVHWFWNPWCCSKFKAQIGTGRGVASIRSAGFCNGKRAWDSNSYSTASTMSVAQLKMEQRRWSSAPFLAYLPDIPCSQVQVLFRYLQVTYKSPLISTQVSLDWWIPFEQLEPQQTLTASFVFHALSNHNAFQCHETLLERAHCLAGRREVFEAHRVKPHMN